MDKQPSQANYIMAYFMQRPKQALAYDDWTDELASEYKSLTGNTARHFRSIVRRLSGEGKLLKVKNGVYMYDPDFSPAPQLPKFTAAQRRQIKERDEYQCVFCGMGRREGFTLYVGFLFCDKPDRASDISNGVTFCSRHRLSNVGSIKDLISMQLSQLNELIQREHQHDISGLIKEYVEIYKRYEDKI